MPEPQDPRENPEPESVDSTDHKQGVGETDENKADQHVSNSDTMPRFLPLWTDPNEEESKDAARPETIDRKDVVEESQHADPITNADPAVEDSVEQPATQETALTESVTPEAGDPSDEQKVLKEGTLSTGKNLPTPEATTVPEAEAVLETATTPQPDPVQQIDKDHAAVKAPIENGSDHTGGAAEKSETKNGPVPLAETQHPERYLKELVESDHISLARLISRKLAGKANE